MPCGESGWYRRRTARDGDLPGGWGQPGPYRVVAGVPNPGTVMTPRVIATMTLRTSATVSTARISAMVTGRLPVVARCAGGRRGHSCGRGAGARSRRRWRPTHGGSVIVD